MTKFFIAFWVFLIVLLWCVEADRPARFIPTVRESPTSTPNGLPIILKEASK